MKNNPARKHFAPLISAYIDGELSPEERVGKYKIGLLHKAERPEYCEEYHKLKTHAQERVREAARKIAESEAMKPSREGQGGEPSEN